MPPASPPPNERRRDHALRALYLRVDTLEKRVTDLETLSATQAKELEGAVTHKWLVGVIIGLCVVLVGGALNVQAKTAETAAASEKRAVEVTGKLAEKLEKAISDQTESKVKTEALYLLFVEQKPRAVVREEVQRKTER